MELALFSGTSKLKERASLFYKLTRSFLIQQSRCVLCACRCQKIPMICRYCYQDLIRFNYQHLNHNLLNWPNIANHIKHKHIDRLVSASPYLWPLNQWIPLLKYHKQSHYSCLLGNFIAPFIKRHIYQAGYEDAILIPVPISTSRWHQRQYNQCHLIGKQIVKRIPDIEYRPDLLAHVGSRKSQVGKSGQARRKQGTYFDLLQKDLLKNRSVILLDDVLTTGTTANNIAKLLKRNGVNKVAVVTIALSLPD